MNLTNFRKTPLPLVVETIRREAERYGSGIYNSELVGLIPQAAMVNTAVWYTQMDLFSPDQVLEGKMAEMIGEKGSADFIESLAAPTPTPGGGSAAAYAGAMAAGLVSMVARLTIGKKGYSDVEAAMDMILEESEILRNDLTSGVVEDSEAFDQVMAAYKIPNSDPGRAAAIQEATLLAAQIPLAAAKKSSRVAELALETAASGNKNAITDAGSAVNLAVASVNSAAYNVRINLADLDDQKQKKQILSELREIEEGALVTLDKIKTILTERGGLFS